jgi:hypothetical protein
MDQVSLMSLPSRILLDIFRGVRLEDLFALSGTCKRFRRLAEADDQALWRGFVALRWRELGFLAWLDEICTQQQDISSPLRDRLLRPDACDWRWMTKCFMTKVDENGNHSGFGFAYSPLFFSLGEWRNGQLHGLGIRMYKGKHFFFGQWENGKWHGQGTVLSATPETGGLYVGQYWQSMSHGFGFKRWANGASYKGEWKNNRISGHGVYTWATGSVYEGQWADNERSGFGTYVWPNGSKYVGEWKGNNFHGQGTKYYENGDVFRGTWEDDLQCGKGEYRTAFGSTYEGEYERGRKQGEGRFTHPDGTTWTGLWVNNLPVRVHEALHPTLKQTLQEKKCTRGVTKSTPFYAQLLHQCLTCHSERGSSSTNESYLCEHCVRECHSHGGGGGGGGSTNSTNGHNFTLVWTFGASFCQCLNCASHDTCAAPSIQQPEN